MSIKSDLDFIKKAQKEIILLSQISYILEWDQLVNLPSAAGETRAEQISLIEANLHNKKLSNKLYSKLRRLMNKKLSQENKIIVNKLYKEISRARKLPEKYIQSLSKAQSLSQDAWHKAKEEKNFKLFQPHLEKIINLNKIKCKLINLPGHPYNSLLGYYEEGMTVEKLRVEFKKLKEGLIEIIRKIESTEKYKEQNKKINSRTFEKEHQIDLVHDVIKRIGLSNISSRLDFSVHPFTTRLGEKDIRVTTAIREDNPLFAFQAAIHEAGHGLYELNLPDNYLDTFVYDAPSYGLHESQSRIWENNIGLSKSFWKFYFKDFKNKFKIKENLSGWYEEVNQLIKTPIRLNSDEIHYCLHIILRFELELDLFEGKIDVKDLPKIWNKKIKEFFGIKVKNDSEGILQDSHWSSGSFGYFPTYAIGTIYASQLYLQMKKDIKDFDKKIEIGDFKEISNWLKNKIHNKGSTMNSEEIIKSVCGEGLNVQKYLDYLNEKYSKIYKFKI